MRIFVGGMRTVVNESSFAFLARKYDGEGGGGGEQHTTGVGGKEGGGGGNGVGRMAEFLRNHVGKVEQRQSFARGGCYGLFPGLLSLFLFSESNQGASFFSRSTWNETLFRNPA